MNDRERKGRWKGVRGETNGQSKLTQEQVIGIMARLLTGKETFDHVASSYGVSVRAARDIWSGKNWAWLFNG
jgi:hypothetical protein